METAKPKTNLRSVINQVTKEKLALLDLQRRTLKSHFSPILEKYEKEESKASLEFLREIHTALKTCTIVTDEGITKDLSVYMNWIKPEDQQAAVYFGSGHLVQHWIDQLIQNIKFHIEKCEYSCLYANVMTQYMDVNSDEVEIDDAVIVDSAEGDSQTDKEKTIQEFSERIFTPPPKDFSITEFNEFLNTKLFNMEDPEQKELYYTIRKELKDFCDHFPRLCSDSLTTDHIKHVIDGLLAEDLLGAEPAVTLKELKENEDALSEVCTLLKNRIQNVAMWSWPSPVTVDFRRNMAGRYRAYMDEDIITAILLHYLGAFWSIRMKIIFKRIYQSKMWKRGTGTLGDLYYKNQSIESFRREFHEKAFLSVLPNRIEDLAATGNIYGDESARGQVTGFAACASVAPEACFAKRAIRKPRNEVLTPMKVKQQLLHLISNEAHLNFTLRPNTPFILAQTDMEWFGPSLVHDVIISLMGFFGVTQQWQDFFRKFLESPLIVGSEVQIRRRGVPLSHALSALFGESVLFVMDLYVNQVSGLSLFRIHDDFWFWGHNTETVIKAWTAIQTFVKVAGLKLNEEKSASVVCKADGDSNSAINGPVPLPQMKVKWGFVVMHSDGVFRINKGLLDPHVKEMKDCLQKCETVMSWVHCHNRYIRFFIRNFAQPAQTFGIQHVVQILTSLRSIFDEVHKEARGDPVEALKQKFQQIWGDKDVMDSWVNWPVQDGGLGLYNPFLELIPLHEAFRKHEERLSSIQGDGPVTSKFAQVIDTDKARWEKILEESKKRRKRRFHDAPTDLEEDTVTDMENSDGEADEGSDDENFGPKGKSKRSKHKKRIGYNVWCERYRETMWGRWRTRYCELLKNLDPVEPMCSSNWKERMYGQQLEDKFGDSSFINTDLIPLSLISAMQAARVHTT